MAIETSNEFCHFPYCSDIGGNVECVGDQQQQ